MDAMCMSKRKQLIDKIEHRIERLSGEKGRKFDEEICCWHDDMDRGLRVMELRWVLKNMEAD